MTYGTKPLAARKPGSFKTFCKLGAWRDVAIVLAMDPPLEGAYPERWNHVGDHSEMLVPCDVESSAAADFEAHMLDVHGRKPGWKPPLESGWDCGRTPTIKCRSAKPASGGNGRPFKPSTKALEKTARTCPSCDLHGEVEGNAGELWWDEHVRGCALVMAGAAS